MTSPALQIDTRTDRMVAILAPNCPSLTVYHDFISAEQSQELYQLLIDSQDWPANAYEVFGRRFELPRLQTWHADEGIVYSYSNNLLQTRPWLPLLQDIKTQIETYLNQRFNAVLMNYYRNGNDYVGWHSDDEPELGSHPFIASLSLGAERIFAYQHKRRGRKGEIGLSSGSLLTMAPEFQHNWQHSVPKEPLVQNGRINLTFRLVEKKL